WALRACDGVASACPTSPEAASDRRASCGGAYLLCHLPSQKAIQDKQQLGSQVAERGLDLRLGPGGIPRLQGVKGETGIVVTDKGDVRVALRCLADSAGQENAGRVDAERCHQSLPQRVQPVLMRVIAFASCIDPPIISV